MPLQPGVRAGNLAFAVADGRGSDGKLPPGADVARQTALSLENLRSSLRRMGLDLEHVVSLWVMLPDYDRLDAVARVVNERFPDPKRAPALTFLGNSGLDNACAVRLDAIASTDADRRSIIVPEVPLLPGVIVHGVYADGMAFLSGLSAPELQGKGIGETLYQQVSAVLERIDMVLRSQKLGLGDVGRTWMFQRDLTRTVRDRYSQARSARYKGIFTPDKFPANSGIQLPKLGEGTMLRSVAFAGRNKSYVVSDKVRLSPNSFSQAVRFGDWLYVAGIDAFDLKRQIQHPGNVAGQTEHSLELTRHIVEAAGGRMENIVKTTSYVLAGQDHDKFATAYRSHFEKHAGNAQRPSSLVLDVQQLSEDVLVEIDTIAYLGTR